MNKPVVAAASNSVYVFVYMPVLIAACLWCQEASEQPDLYGIRRSGRQRKEVTRLSLGAVRITIY